MNSLERIVATLGFQTADRVPVIAQVFGHAATISGVPVNQYVRDGSTLARCQLNALTEYGYDAVFSVMDTSVETEAAGSILDYRRNHYPIVQQYALSMEDDFGDLAVPDPQQAGRMPEMLEALSIMRGELRDEVLVVGCVMGPLTLATQLLGMETALFLGIDDPARLQRLLDYATDVIIRFGEAQIEAGAHLPIVFDPSASPAVIPPNFFREFELPRLQRVFTAFKAAGAAANWLHIAGPAQRILPYFPEAGVDISNFDYYVSAEEANDALPGGCIDGNIKPVTFMEGDPRDVEAEARDLLSAFADRGGFILSSGCEIPPESKAENVAAMVGAARA